jgi:hypothetical protein
MRSGLKTLGRGGTGQPFCNLQAMEEPSGMPMRLAMDRATALQNDLDRLDEP